MFTWQELGPFGGHVFLDFVNTVDDDGKTRNVNALPDWPVVVEWSTAMGLVSANEEQGLVDTSKVPDADEEFSQLMQLREAAWTVLSQTAANLTPEASDLKLIGDTVQWALAHSALEQADRGLRWTSQPDELGLQVIRARLGLALLDLITAQELNRLTECGRCTGLFLNKGRGRGRRWCRMTACGNREKIARFRSKT